MIPAGRLTKRIQLQRLKDPPDRGPGGQAIKTYITYAVVWAAFRTLSGGERLASQQVASKLSHEVTIRWRKEVCPDDRIVFFDRTGERILDIKDVRNVDERNEEIRMICNEAVT